MKRFIIILLFVSMQLSYSQVKWEWEQAGWKNFDIINTMTTIDDNIIVGTRNNIQYSNDEGKTWVKTNVADGIQNFAQNGNLIVASNASGAVYISYDKGETWDNIGSSVITKGAFSIAIEGTTIVAGAYGGADIYISNDLGGTWENKSTGLATNKDLTISSIEIVEGNIFIGIRNGYSSGGGGLYYSSNMGESWELKGFSNINVSKVFYTTNKLFVTTDKLNVSNDMGNNWEQLDFSQSIRSIIVAGNTLYTGTYSGVYASEDAGSTWSELGLIDKSINSLAFLNNSLVASHSDGIYLFNKENNEWVLLVEKIDLGQATTLTVDENNIYISNDDRILYKSSNFGESWQEIKTNDIEYSVIKSINGKLYINSLNTKEKEYGIFISTNNGESWEKPNSPIETLDNAKVSAIDNYGNNIFLATNVGLFVSEDNGESFDLEFNEFSSKNISQLLIIENQLFANIGGEIYTSNDLGKSWSKISGLPKAQLVQPTLASDGNNRFVAGFSGVGEESGVYLSEDKGNTWEYISNDGFRYNNMVIREAKRVYAVEDYIFVNPDKMGVFVTNNKGETWQVINYGLENKGNGPLQVNSFNKMGEYIVLASKGGFFRAKMSDIIATDVGEDNLLYSSYSNLLIYPNPSSDFINISVDNDAVLHSREVQILNLLGLVVSKQELRDGNNRIDISDLPRGTYFIKIGDKVEKFVKM